MAYVPIQLAEMKDVLRADKGWVETDPHAGEYVFQFELKKTFPGAVVKVYSSIRKDNSHSRGVGEDAIKVLAVYLPTKRGIVKTHRVYRVPGWQNRLVSVVREVVKLTKARKRWITGTGM